MTKSTEDARALLIRAIVRLSDASRNLKTDQMSYFPLDDETWMYRRTWGDELCDALKRMSPEKLREQANSVVIPHNNGQMGVVAELSEVSDLIHQLFEPASRAVAVFEQILHQPFFRVRNLSEEKRQEFAEPLSRAMRSHMREQDFECEFRPIDERLIADLTQAVETTGQRKQSLDGDVPDEKGFVVNPSDPNVYSPARNIVTWYSLNFKAIDKILKDHPRIRWTRPRTKKGDIDQRRRNIHIGDFEAYAREHGLSPVADREPDQDTIKAQAENIRLNRRH